MIIYFLFLLFYVKHILFVLEIFFPTFVKNKYNINNSVICDAGC